MKWKTKLGQSISETNQVKVSKDKLERLRFNYNITWTQEQKTEGGDLCNGTSAMGCGGGHLQVLLYACMDKNHMFEVMRTLIKNSSPLVGGEVI